jgi:hypothetical protein
MSMPESGAVHAALPPTQVASVRAQILATEHWSLLATRSMTWSEVMSRIVIHLTVLSAGLVVLALLAQAQGFGRAFQVLSIGLAAVALVLGTLTGLRVYNASDDDAAMLIGMNRLRNAYVDLDPGMEPYLVTSRYDDAAGLSASYLMGRRRSTASHVLASTGMFVTVVNAIVAGTLGGLIALAAEAPVWLIAVIGAVSSLAYLTATIAIAARRFGSNSIESRFPSPGQPLPSERATPATR